MIESIILNIVSPLLTLIAGYLFGRRQSNANANSTEINNFSEAIDAYKKMYEDMEVTRKREIDELKQENKELKNELSENRKQIITLTNFVLASAIKRADGSLSQDDIENLRQML